MAAAANGHIFVAPDNGVLSLVLQTEMPPRLFRRSTDITNQSLFPEPVSHTFHGRDIFAPVAAHLARGMPIESVGPHIVDFLINPCRRRGSQGDRLVGVVLRIDKFGNIITNLRRENLPSGIFD